MLLEGVLRKPKANIATILGIYQNAGQVTPGHDPGIPSLDIG